METAHPVYAIGDIHGDYERAIAVLAAAKIIPGGPGPPEKVQWQAGQAVLVCTGDMIDKGNQSLRVLALMRALQAKALEAGGRVVVSLGNHEAEFLANPRNKKALEFITEMEAAGLVPEHVAAGADAPGVGQWLRGLPAAIRVNDWFFAHAGNTHGRSLAQLKDDCEKGITAKGFAAPVLQDPDSLLLARMNPRPWWEASGDTAAQSRDKLAKCVRALGVNHLVIGHQPGKIGFADGTSRKAGELVQHFDGLIFLIDVGMSRAVGYSSGAMLQIKRDGDALRAFRILASGKSEAIWTSHSAAGKKRGSAPVAVLSE